MKKREYLKPSVKNTEYLEVTLLSDSPGGGGGGTIPPEPGGDL